MAMITPFQLASTSTQHQKQIPDGPATEPHSLRSHPASSTEVPRPTCDALLHKHPSELGNSMEDQHPSSGEASYYYAPRALPHIPPSTCYLYYRVYVEDGVILSRSPIDSTNSYLGCIDAHYVTPPHTVESIKRFLCRIELANHNQTQLYQSALSTIPMNAREHLSATTGPGTSSKQPLALVKRSDGFTKPIRMTADWNYSDSPPAWLRYSKNEILYTDGIARTEVYNRNRYASYLAQNAAGRIGLVAICLAVLVT